MVHYRDRYRNESYCKDCKCWTPEPTHSIKELAVEILPNPEHDKHPEIKVVRVYYDEEGRKHTILARLYLLSKTWVKPISCRKCGKQCRGKPHNKTDKRSRKDKRRAKQENTISDSVKIKQMDEIIRLLKIQVEYENDPSCRLDDKIQIGTSHSFMRGQIEQTLEGVLKIRERYSNPEQEIQELQLQQDLDVERFVKAINNSPQIISYIEERLKPTNLELYSKVLKRLKNENKTSNVI